MSSLVSAPVGLLSFMRIYFLPGHKEMKGLRTWRNLSETTAPLEIRPKTRELSWEECREEKKKRKASLRKTKGPDSTTELLSHRRGASNDVGLFSFCQCSFFMFYTPLAFALHSSSVIFIEGLALFNRLFKFFLFPPFLTSLNKST